ncbi:hypothetical protein ACFL20_10080 [Spirochaetota bacterium]
MIKKSMTGEEIEKLKDFIVNEVIKLCWRYGRSDSARDYVRQIEETRPDDTGRFIKVSQRYLREINNERSNPNLNRKR